MLTYTPGEEGEITEYELDLVKESYLHSAELFGKGNKTRLPICFDFIQKKKMILTHPLPDEQLSIFSLVLGR